MLCSTLDKVARKEVVFDPKNKEHIKAMLMLRFEHKQHPTLRFALEDGYNTIPNMMVDKTLRHMFKLSA